MDLIEYSDRIRVEADEFLNQLGILDYLKMHGKLTITGSYASNIMIKRDIDIYVTRDIDFTIEEFVEIFKEIFLAKITPGIHCGNETDFTNPRRSFPKGFYMGIKNRYNGKKWKIDIWFMHKDELNTVKYINLNDKINDENRELILSVKKYVMDNNLDFSSVQIYDAIFIDKIKTLEEFINKLFDDL